MRNHAIYKGSHGGNMFQKNLNRIAFLMAGILFLGVITGWLVFLMKPADSCADHKKTGIVTIFVHGTIHPGSLFVDTLSLSDIHAVAYDSIRFDSEYLRALQEMRSKPEKCTDQIMLEEGLALLDNSSVAHGMPMPGLISFRSSDISIQSLVDKGVQASHQYPVAHIAADCYRAFAYRWNPHSDHILYTFGHLGVLSHRYRERIALELYQAIADIKRSLQDDYAEIKIIVVAHSHGGNIVLCLARAEELLQQGLYVDEVVLFGTPLQKETAGYAYYPIFGRVINCYSLGDKIQGSDIVSTSSRRCFKTFAHAGPRMYNPGKVYDIQLSVNHDPYAVTHSSMWCMQKERRSQLCHVYPLPYAVIAPLLLQGCDILCDHAVHGAIAELISTKKSCAITLRDARTHHEWFKSNNVYHDIMICKMRALSYDEEES